ncbi:TPA: sensor histidine kinase [Streptococcus pyogenes]|uniref:Sensor histidine kinase n=1 Tax=Streptococcus pyogenes TaxID=1314 RepID=A0A660A2Q6_STRPY|nr:sensor histidine kinase [Streptococcus pyogenes]EPZ46043.1 histidine kinase [Streptococcus pyogenes GA40634]HER4521592.1 sensor histidine kinase [Streptococcus pyogenes NGAS760]HER4525421.1 sensor histidine kinase [Streptococcus pyogenes NGAS758]HER4529871.1 sensor histidine kinase [Streptococcus pyogenes NGAS746]HER4530320.1 sensor histidine kinase [Streptococcus pyogenes NGAS759]HER4533669.1 sensor histidine kinase [Streptococcus pyogenes NGAS737]HER4540325.1 sensor histidine kinase [St
MRGEQVEEHFKKQLQDDISRHFSYQSLMLSLLLIGLFIIFSLAPQQLGLYRDINATATRYHRLISKQEALLDELGKNSLLPFLNKNLSTADLSKHYFHLRHSSQTSPELLLFSPNQGLLFASNPHLGNVFSKSVYIQEVLRAAHPPKTLFKVAMDSEDGHYLMIIKPMIDQNQLKGYAFLVMSGKDFLHPTKTLTSELVIADKLDNTVTFSNREFIASSLDKINSQYLHHYFVFQDNRAFITRKVALQGGLWLYMYRPLIPMVSVMLFSLISSAVIFVILQRKSSGLANRIAAKNSRAINQMVRDMSAISRQEKRRIDLESQDEFQYLSDQINQMVERLQQLHDKTLDLETQKLLFEKRMLEAQFNPHFLYNTLETILITSHYDSALTEKIVIQLTKLLRYSLTDSSKPVLLKDDLSVIESYLVINQVRFEELQYSINLSPDLDSLAVPKLFLLPLIENAIKYGLKERHDVKINIACYYQDDHIIFSVRDNGSGIDAHHQKVIREQLEAGESHHGLINSYRRLKYHFSEVSLVFDQGDKQFNVSYHVKE